LAAISSSSCRDSPVGDLVKFVGARWYVAEFAQAARRPSSRIKSESRHLGMSASDQKATIPYL